MCKIELLVRTATHSCVSCSHQVKAIRKAINTGLLKQILCDEKNNKPTNQQTKNPNRVHSEQEYIFFFMDQNERFGPG